MSRGYVASCACGWLGGDYQTPEPAKREGADHEADPEAKRSPLPQQPVKQDTEEAASGRG